MPWYHCSNLHGLYPFHLELKYIYVTLRCWKKEEERKERREKERYQVSNICFMKQNKITTNVYWTGSLWTPPWNHLVCRNGKAAGGSSFHGVLFENKEEISQVTDGFRHSSHSYCSQGTWKNWLELAGSQLSWEAKDLERKKKDRVPKSTAQGHLLPQRKHWDLLAWDWLGYPHQGQIYVFSLELGFLYTRHNTVGYLQCKHFFFL